MLRIINTELVFMVIDLLLYVYLNETKQVYLKLYSFILIIIIMNILLINAIHKLNNSIDLNKYHRLFLLKAEFDFIVKSN